MPKYRHSDAGRGREPWSASANVMSLEFKDERGRAKRRKTEQVRNTGPGLLRKKERTFWLLGGTVSGGGDSLSQSKGENGRTKQLAEKVLLRGRRAERKKKERPLFSGGETEINKS